MSAGGCQDRRDKKVIRAYLSYRELCLVDTISPRSPRRARSLVTDISDDDNDVTQWTARTFNTTRRATLWVEKLDRPSLVGTNKVRRGLAALEGRH